MERLTHYYNGKVAEPYNRSEARAMAQKLAEYEDAEEAGRLVRLPCRAGSTVYKICPVWNREIIKPECHRCPYQECDCFDIGYEKEALINAIREEIAPDELWILKRKPYFGGIYFLSREAAETALKARNDSA